MAGRISKEVERELTRLKRFVPDVRKSEPLRPGTHLDGVHIDVARLQPIVIAAARRINGVAPSAKQAEVVWSQGSDELVVDAGGIVCELADGAVQFTIPVGCDQTGPTKVAVLFAVGSADQPAGLIASAGRIPVGPTQITQRWSDELVAFAWSVLLETVNGVASAMGFDRAGDRLVAGEMIADKGGLTITPLARHRFGGAAK